MEKMSEGIKVKKNNPKFTRQNAANKPRLGAGWRRPKGLQSKLRLQKAGHSKKVSIGFRNAKKDRHTHRSGARSQTIYNLNQLETVDLKNVIIIANVGLKKKVQIIKEAVKKSIIITNIKDPQKFLERIEKRLKEKKEAKTKREEEKKKKEAKEKPKEKDKLEEKVEGEEKKKEEKKEKDKVLTKRV